MNNHIEVTNKDQQFQMLLTQEDKALKYVHKPDDTFMKISNVAAILKVSKNAVRNYMSDAMDDRMPHCKIGKVIRIPIKEFNEWLARQIKC